MFGLFNPKPQQHPTLGTLAWRSGHWRGSISLTGNTAIPLILAGSKTGPDNAAVAEALALAQGFAELQPVIARALFEHFEPYAEGLADGTLSADDADLPNLRDANDALDHATLVAVVVAPLDGVMTVELCYTTAWDVEHTLGARFQRDKWLELCGSVLVP